MSPIIDCHQHFWKLERRDYTWLTPELQPLYKDFLPQHLGPLLQSAGVEKTVVVQAADTLAETQYLLSLAEQEDFIAAVVGWVDMEQSDAPECLAQLSENPWFTGIRPMIQDIADPGWMLKPELQPAFEALLQYGLTFDALVKPAHLENLLMLLDRYPSLPVVINHGAKPNIAEGNNGEWISHMRTLAKLDNCYCKLSGLLTEAGDNPLAQQVQPYTDFLLEQFGVNKLMWGSDWPVLNLAGYYPDWLAMSKDFIAHLPDVEQQRIMGGTAAKFYGLN